MSGDGLELQGLVVAESRGGFFDVDATMPDGSTRRVLAKRAGRLIRNHVGLVAGDRVTVEVGIYDLTRGRVISRERTVATSFHRTTRRR